jgi:hypothetical protein
MHFRSLSRKTERNHCCCSIIKILKKEQQQKVFTPVFELIWTAHNGIIKQNMLLIVRIIYLGGLCMLISIIWFWYFFFSLKWNMPIFCFPNKYLSFYKAVTYNKAHNVRKHWERCCKSFTKILRLFISLRRKFLLLTDWPLFKDKPKIDIFSLALCNLYRLFSF